MVALFVLLTFAAFIAIDLLVFRSKWAKVLREKPGTVEAPSDAMYNLPEVGLTMADGDPEEKKEEDEKK
jgi:hypothetical protein